MVCIGLALSFPGLDGVDPSSGAGFTSHATIGTMNTIITEEADITVGMAEGLEEVGTMVDIIEVTYAPGGFNAEYALVQIRALGWRCFSLV